MSVIAEFTVSYDDFLLADALEATREMYVEVRRMVADGAESVTPYFWASNGDFDAFERAIEDDQSIADLQVSDRRDDERFYRAVWSDDLYSRGIVHALTDVKATLLEAVASGGRWELRMLFPNESTVSSFYDFCASNGLTFELTNIYRGDVPPEFGRYGVTSDQHEALVAAFEDGYFEVPRQIRMAELADRLGISQNALSARLRRGHENLLGHTLVRSEEPDG